MPLTISLVTSLAVSHDVVFSLFVWKIVIVATVVMIYIFFNLLSQKNSVSTYNLLMLAASTPYLHMPIGVLLEIDWGRFEEVIHSRFMNLGLQRNIEQQMAEYNSGM